MDSGPDEAGGSGSRSSVRGRRVILFPLGGGGGGE